MLPTAPKFLDRNVLKLYLDKQRGDDDDMLDVILAAAEAFADRYCNRQWASEDGVTKSYTWRGRPYVRISDCRSATLVNLAGVTLIPVGPLGAGTGYILNTDWEPATEIEVLYGMAFPGSRLQISGNWGWNPVPPDMIDAMYVLASRMYRERDAVYGDTITNDMGTITYLRGLPSRARATFEQYRVIQVALV